MIPAQELKQRISNLQEALRNENIGGALIVQRADLYYFSGTGQNAHLLVPAQGEPELIVKKSLVRAEAESSLSKIIPFSGWEQLVKSITALIPTGAAIGLENDVLPVTLYERYKKLLKGFQLTDISGIIRKIRAVKSEYEINQLREAAKISTAVFNKARETIREGLSELELAATLESEARLHGHQGAVRMRGFNQELYYGHIMAGESAATLSFFDGPTGGPGLNPSFPQGAGLAKIKKGEPILVDFVSIAAGYLVDQTRIFSLGPLPLHLREAYQTAREIKSVIVSLAKPGVNGSDLFDKAESIAAERGLANHFMGYIDKVSFIAHGLGLELDEWPVLARGFDLPLEGGMVFALEPKFVFPGEGTVGIEDTFVVRKTGLEELTDFSDELQVI